MRYLYEKVIPELYDIYLQIDLNNDKYIGHNKINIRVEEDTNKIEFHGKELKIISIFLDDKEVNKYTYDEENNIYILKLNNKIKKGKYILSIKFKNDILIGKTGGAGFLKHTVTGEREEDRIVYYTQFEPNNARKCFPCWDEPNYKVKYNMKIEINDPLYKVLFNTDPEEVKTIDDKTIYKFTETIPMSTYVSSFIIGKFNYVEKLTDDDIRVRIYVPKDIEEYEKVSKYALDTSVLVMYYLTTYYKYPYALKKLDLIAIDNTNATGMENYGLIFCDLQYLLYDKNISTINYKIEIALLIAHEIAHQWFGNLITMEKWDELWLKESFAKFFEIYVVDKIFPTWNIKSYFIVKLLETMYFDSMSSKSIIGKIKHNNHISQVYDQIVYEKGAAILFMIMNYIGEDNFRNNISSYLKKYEFKNITSNEFINSLIYSLSEEKKKNVVAIIKSFINNKGVPLVIINDSNIEVVPFNTPLLIRNSINNKYAFNNMRSTKWTIPINNSSDFHVVNKENEGDIDLNNLFIVNDKSMNYYRICYSKNQISILLENINKLDSKQHISILNDLFVLSLYKICSFNYWIYYMMGLVDYLITFDKVEQFDYYLIDIISDFIDYKNDLNEIKSSLIINTVNNIFNKLIKHLTNIFKADDKNTYINMYITIENINYNQILMLLLDINSKKNQNIITYLFDNKLFTISGELNYIIFKHIIKQDLKKNMTIIKNLINDKKYSWLKSIIISSYIHSPDIQIIDYIFDLWIDQSKDNLLEYSDINELFTINKYFVKKYTDYFIHNYDKYISKFSIDSYIFTKILKKLISAQSNLEQIKLLFNFIKYAKYNDKYIIVANQYKQMLFNKLFLKQNAISILNNV